MPKTYVYRSGPVQAPVERSCEAAQFAAVDAVRPAGSVSRTDAIFAAPTLTGATRWVRGNALAGAEDVKVRQIAVDSDAVMVYSIDAWDRASTSFAREEHYYAYWASGMTLTDWLTAGLDPEEWEVLLDADDILGVRPVSAARTVAAARDEFWGQQTKRALEHH